MAAMIKHRFSMSFLETFISNNARSSKYIDSDEISPPSSPYPGRRPPFSARLEAELHLACARVVSNNIPSDAWLDDSTEMMDFDLPVRSVLPPPPPPAPLVPAPSKRSLRDRSWSGSAFRNISMPSFLTEKSAKRATISISRPLHIEEAAEIMRPSTSRNITVKKRSSLYGLGVMLNPGRKRADTTGAIDGPPHIPALPAPISKSTQASNTFSVVTTSLSRPAKFLRKAMSMESIRPKPPAPPEIPANDRRKHVSAVAPEQEDYRMARFLSYHADVNPDHRMMSFIESDGARDRRSWYQSWLNLDREKRPDERSFRSRTPSRSLIGSRGRLFAREVELDLPIEVPSAQPSRQISVTAESHKSRRSSASSGVMPTQNPQARLSWRPFRKSWHSWREASDDEGDIPGLRTMFRKSGSSLKDRRSGTVLKDMPPLPGVDQMQGDRPVSATDVERPIFSVTKRNKSIGKRRSADSFKSAAEHRVSVGSRTSLEIRKSVDIRSSREVKRPTLDKAWSHSELQRVKETEVMEKCDSPEAKKDATADLQRAESIGTCTGTDASGENITPADSLIDGQVQQATAVTMRKAVVDVSPVKAVALIREMVIKEDELKRTSSTVKELPATIEEISTTVKIPPLPLKEASSAVEQPPALIKEAYTRAENSKISPVEVAIDPILGDKTAIDAPKATPVEAIQVEDTKQAEPPVQVISDQPAPPSQSTVKRRRSSVYSWLPSETRRSSEITTPRRPMSMALQPGPSEKILEDISEVQKRPMSIVIQPGLPQKTPEALSEVATAPSQHRARLSRHSMASMSSMSRRSFSYPEERKRSRDDNGSISVVSDDYFEDCLESQMGIPSTVPAAIMEEIQAQVAKSRQPSIAVRNNSVQQYNALRPGKYMFADDIDTLSQPLAPASFVGRLVKKRSKLWPFKQKKANSWMDEMEKLGIKDGMLLIDQLNGPPIVRY